MNLIVIRDSEHMTHVKDKSVDLILTSPPYFKTKYHFSDLYPSYEAYLEKMEKIARELYRVLKFGRVAIIIVGDVSIDGKLYPVVADWTKLMEKVGFAYQDSIVWFKKAPWYRIYKRSFTIEKYPYPRYYYPNPAYDMILIFRKGDKLERWQDEKSKITISFMRTKLYINVWELNAPITDPHHKHVDDEAKGIFTEELARYLIMFYSYRGETVLDPFCGSGTTAKVAWEMERNFICYEINKDLLEVIKRKVGLNIPRLDGRKVEAEIIVT